MTTTTATEQQNYDALLAGEIPDTLREAVTRDCRGCDAYGEGPDNMLEGDHETDCPKRRPLPLAEAHVAAERYVLTQYEGDIAYQARKDTRLGDWETVKVSWWNNNSFKGTGADIFAAIGAALKGGE